MSQPFSFSDHAGSSSDKGVLHASVMRLMADYTLQTLDELSALQDSSLPILSKRKPEIGNACNASPSRAFEEETTLQIADMAEASTDELQELTLRAKRIERVVGLVELWARRQQGGSMYRSRQGHLFDPTSTQRNEGMVRLKTQEEDSNSRCAGSSVFPVRAHGAVAIRAVEGLHDCLARLSTAEVCPVEIKRAEESAHVIRPIARPRGLIDAAIELYSANVRTVFRKVSKTETKSKPSRPLSVSTTCASDGPESAQERQKRSRSSKDVKELQGSTTAVSNAIPSVFEEIASSQRKQRFALYTGRVPLLPRVDALARGVASNSSTFIYLSPALRLYAGLNLSAERQMLQRAWRTTNKAQLLLQLPRLHQAEKAYQEQLRELFSQRGGSESSGRPWLNLGLHRYFRFVRVNEGVLRMGIQHGLFVDFTYDCAGAQWVVLKLHWNVWVLAASIWFSSSLSPNTTGHSVRAGMSFRAGAENSDSSAYTDGRSIHIVLPQRQDVMLRFIQKNLTKGGLEDGLLAANQLLCMVVMDTLAKQARQLQKYFFVSLLKTCFVVDIRPGSHLAVQLRLPIADHQTQSDGRNSSAVLVNLHKFYPTAGTVLVESTTANGSSTAHDGLNTRLLLSDVSLVDGNKLLVNLEQWLWEGTFATDVVAREASPH